MIGRDNLMLHMWSEVRVGEKTRICSLKNETRLWSEVIVGEKTRICSLKNETRLGITYLVEIRTKAKC